MKHTLFLLFLACSSVFAQFDQGIYGPDIVLSKQVQFVDEHELETGPQSPNYYPRYQLVKTSDKGFFYLVKVQGEFKVILMQKNLALKEVFSLEVGTGLTLADMRQIEVTDQFIHFILSGKESSTPKKMVGIYSQDFEFASWQWSSPKLIENVGRKELADISIHFKQNDSLYAICNLKKNELIVRDAQSNLVYNDLELRPQDDKLEELRVKSVEFGKTSQLYVLFEEEHALKFHPQTNLLKRSDCIALAAYDEEGGKIERFEKEKDKAYVNAVLKPIGEGWDVFYQWLDRSDRTNTGMGRIHGANMKRDQLFTFNVDTDELFVERVGKEVSDLKKVYNYASNDQFNTYFAPLFVKESEGELTMLVQKQTPMIVEFGNSNTGTSAKGASGVPTDGLLDNSINTFTAVGDLFLLKIDSEFNVKEKKKVERSLLLELERDNYFMYEKGHHLHLLNFGKLKNQTMSDPLFYGRPTVLNQLDFDLINYTYTSKQTAIHNHTVPVKLMLANSIIEGGDIYVLGARAGHENLAKFKLP